MVTIVRKGKTCLDNDFNSTCIERSSVAEIVNIAPAETELTGGTVEISGKHFGTDTKVWFGDKPAVRIKVINHLRIEAVAPPVAAPGSVDVKVATGNGRVSTLHNAYRYEEEFRFTGVSPASGPSSGGTTLTLKGTGFTNKDTFVSIGGGKTQIARFIDQNTIQIVTQSHDPGVVTIGVSIGEDEKQIDDAFTFE